MTHGRSKEKKKEVIPTLNLQLPTLSVVNCPTNVDYWFPYLCEHSQQEKLYPWLMLQLLVAIKKKKKKTFSWLSLALSKMENSYELESLVCIYVPNGTYKKMISQVALTFQLRLLTREFDSEMLSIFGRTASETKICPFNFKKTCHATCNSSSLFPLHFSSIGEKKVLSNYLVLWPKISTHTTYHLQRPVAS